MKCYGYREQDGLDKNLKVSGRKLLVVTSAVQLSPTRPP
jgi:hypothetical protein